MEKSISIIINETNDKLMQVCNSSGLPPCILEILARNLVNEIHTVAQKQYEQDLLKYSAQLQESNEEKNK